jgi:predicted ATP-grasp superfamily ATP-dependent carboligase
LVLGLNPNALGLVKSLADEGIPVYAVDFKPKDWRDTHVWMSSRTRRCKRILVAPEAGEEGIVDAMVELGSQFDERLPVLPSGDVFLYMLEDHRDRLEPHYVFHVPDADTLDLLMMKGRFHSFCMEHGIDAPATITDVTPELVAEIGDDLNFPCLMKPEFRSDNWGKVFPTEKALEAEDLASLKASVEKAMETGENLMIQEIIPGPDSNLYFSHAYYYDDQVLAGMWTGRKLRQAPPRFGTSTLVETVDVPEVAEMTTRIVEILGLTGYVSVEFKLDERNQTYQILEVTPARSWYPHYLGTSVGLNLPLFWYYDLLGDQSRKLPGFRPPERIAWLDEYRDLVTAYNAWRAGEIRMGEWWGSYRGVRSFALASFRDPVPGILVGVRLCISVLKRLRPGGRGEG